MNKLHGPFLSLEEASAKLAAMGLHGQTPRVLRTAIADSLLPAVKDGRRWRTTEWAVDEYLARMWDTASQATAHPADAHPEPRRGRYRRKTKGDDVPLPKHRPLTKEEKAIRSQRVKDYLRGKRPTWY